MTYKIITLFTILFFSFASTTVDNTTIVNSVEDTEVSKKATIEEEIAELYTVFAEKNTTFPTESSFKSAMIGYYKLADQGLVKKEILTIIDFTLSSTKKRLWVLDMKNQKVLFHSVVAHGKNTGGEFATKFSNTVDSLQSSLGFYLTGETYFGKNGLSMFIDGMEKKFNSRARERYVVVHGSAYATTEFISKAGRLGRSYGCPAVPTALTKKIIDTIKDKSVLYIHSLDQNYIKNSEMIQV